MTVPLFAAFFLCVVAQMVALYRLGAALDARHPEVSRELKTLFVMPNLWWFALSRADRKLGDADLTRRRRQLLATQLVGLLIWLAQAACVATGHA